MTGPIQKEKHIEDDSYNHINNFLSNLKVEEKEDDINKSHLFINQGTRYQNINQVSDNKPEIGVSNSDRDRFVRLIKKQKNEEDVKRKKQLEERKKEYINKLNLLDENNIDPYKVLDISKNTLVRMHILTF